MIFAVCVMRAWPTFARLRARVERTLERERGGNRDRPMKNESN